MLIPAQAQVQTQAPKGKVTSSEVVNPEGEVSYTDPTSQFLEELREKMGGKPEPELSPEEREEAFKAFFASKSQ